MDNLENKLNLEAQIATKKRELKITLAQLDTAKAEYSGVIGLIEKNKVVIDEQNKYLQKTLNDISFERLEWATEKGKQEQELSDRESAANNVLLRKAELNIQEENLRKIEQETTDKLNKNLRLEIELEEKLAAIKNTQNQVEEDKKELVVKEAQLEQNKEEFKAKVRLILEDLTKI